MNFRALIEGAIKLAQQYSPYVQIGTELIKGIALANAEREQAALPDGEQVSRELLAAKLDEIIGEADGIIAAAIADQARAAADKAAETPEVG